MAHRCKSRRRSATCARRPSAEGSRRTDWRFAPRVPRPQHLARYRLAELFLDTFPSDAGATANDALPMRLPLVTLCGKAFTAGLAGSLVRALGLPDLVTTSLLDDEVLSLPLAPDPHLLAAVKTKLAQSHAGTLFDTDRFCRHLEGGDTAMWQRSRRAQPPREFQRQPHRPSTCNVASHIRRPAVGFGSGRQRICDQASPLRPPALRGRAKRRAAVRHDLRIAGARIKSFSCDRLGPRRVQTRQHL